VKRVSVQGFSLVELLVSFTVIAVLSAVFLDRIALYREQAERVAFNAVLDAIRTGLRLQQAMILLKEGPKGLPRMADTNPMEVLHELPSNYLGELPDGRDEKGGWIYDRDGKLLIYKPEFRRYLEVPSGAMELHFRVVVVSGGSGGVVLMPAEEYRWFQPDVK